MSGHSSGIDSVSFDSSEVLVAAGAASGTIKLWDLEEAKSMLVIILFHLGILIFFLFFLFTMDILTSLSHTFSQLFAHSLDTDPTVYHWIFIPLVSSLHLDL